MRNVRRGKKNDRIRPRIALWPTIEFTEEVVEMDEKTEIHRIIVVLDEGMFQFISSLSRVNEKRIPNTCGDLIKFAVRTLMGNLKETINSQTL